MKNKSALRALLLILLLGAFLRIYDIGKESFWADEAATVYTTQQKPSGIVNDIYTTTIHAPEYYDTGGTPPFYFLLANYWTGLIGLSEVKLRLLSAIFGVISIYLIFLIGKMLFDYRVGLASSLILSVNYLHIYFSQEARPYSLVVLLTLLTVYFLLKSLKEQKNGYWIGYVLSAAILIYTHYFGFFVLLFEFLFLLIFWKNYRKSIKNAVFSALGILLLYLPWVPALLRQVFGRNFGSEFIDTNIFWGAAKIFVQFNGWLNPDIGTRESLRNVYRSLDNYASINFSSVSLLGWITILSVLLLTVLLTWLFAAGLLIKNKKCGIGKLMDNIKNREYSLLLLWFLVPIIFSIAISLLFPKSPIFGLVRYVIFASPGYYLIASSGIIKLKKRPIILVLLITLSALPLYSYYANFDKQQWRETSEYLKSHRSASEPLFVNIRTHVLALRYYYDDMENVVGIRNVGEFVGNINRKDSFWFIYTSEQYGDPDGALKKYLDDNYKIDEKKELVGVKIFHYIS